MFRDENIKCYLDDFNLVTIYYDKEVTSFYIEINGELTNVDVEEKGNDIYEIHLPFDVDVSLELVAHINNRFVKTIEKRKVVHTQKFDELFYYSGQLGAYVKNNNTIFNLWAPIATQVILMLDGQPFLMKYNNGVYSKSFRKNLHLKEYYYIVSVNGETKKVVDPYAISSTLNAGSSVVIDISEVLKKPAYKKKPKYDFSVCEINVSDFSNERFNFKYPSKFLSLVEKGVKNKAGQAIGFDYIIDMEYDYVQLMPVYDFGSVNEMIFHNDNNNWGYDPEQYFTTEGSYVNDKSPLSRITELRDVIIEYKKNNIGVIMDVVFNHVYDASTFSFNQITPGYFFRFDEQHMLRNGSFCGNEVASERNMVAKFIMDNLIHYTTLYQVDGYRIDLMGLMDITLGNKIYECLSKINPDIVVYGEGWNMESGLHHSDRLTQINAKYSPSIGFFDDDFRDYVKGRNSDFTDLGVVNLKEAKHLIEKINSGVHIHHEKSYVSTNQLVRYVSCHDDHTLYDYLREINEDEELLSNQIKLCYDYVFKTPGVKFIHIGCDFKRSKNGISNTYNMSKEINMVNWDLLTDNYDINQHVKKLISNSKNK